MYGLFQIAGSFLTSGYMLKTLFHIQAISLVIIVSMNFSKITYLPWPVICSNRTTVWPSFIYVSHCNLYRYSRCFNTSWDNKPAVEYSVCISSRSYTCGHHHFRYHYCSHMWVINDKKEVSYKCKEAWKCD